MSNIQVILPLDVLSGAESLTAEGISAFLSDATKATERADAAERNEKALAQKLVDWVGQLENILDADWNDFRKSQALRELVSETRQFTNFVKGRIQ